ncbi:MAG: hypothetical protein ABI206_17385 [Antricoccus sp.]
MTRRRLDAPDVRRPHRADTVPLSGTEQLSRVPPVVQGQHLPGKLRSRHADRDPAPTPSSTSDDDQLMVRRREQVWENEGGATLPAAAGHRSLLSIH